MELASAFFIFYIGLNYMSGFVQLEGEIVPDGAKGNGFVMINSNGREVSDNMIGVEDAGKIKPSDIEKIVIRHVYGSGVRENRVHIVSALKDFFSSPFGLKRVWKDMILDGRRVYPKGLGLFISIYSHKEGMEFLRDEMEFLNRVSVKCLQEFSILMGKSGDGVGAVNKTRKGKGSERKGSKTRRGNGKKTRRAKGKKTRSNGKKTRKGKKTKRGNSK